MRNTIDMKNDLFKPIEIEPQIFSEPKKHKATLAQNELLIQEALYEHYIKKMKKTTVYKKFTTKFCEEITKRHIQKYPLYEEFLKLINKLQ